MHTPFALFSVVRSSVRIECFSINVRIKENAMKNARSRGSLATSIENHQFKTR